jgi:hypothetical protein
MSLGTRVGQLEAAFVTAFVTASKDGELYGNDGVNRVTLATALALAIKNYYLDAVVNTDVTVNAAQKDQYGGTAISTGTGKGVGTLHETTGFPELILDLSKCFDEAKAEGETGNGSSDSDIVIENMSKKWAKAVHKYMKSVQVRTEVTIDGAKAFQGAPNATAVPNAQIPGVSTGTGAGTGVVVFPNTIPTQPNPRLWAAIYAAYEGARQIGAGGAGVTSTTASLGAGIATAIHAFAIQGKPQTVVDVDGGQSVTGYQMLTPSGAPSPLPPTKTVAHAGTGGKNGDNSSLS